MQILDRRININIDIKIKPPPPYLLVYAVCSLT